MALSSEYQEPFLAGPFRRSAPVSVKLLPKAVKLLIPQGQNTQITRTLWHASLLLLAVADLDLATAHGSTALFRLYCWSHVSMV